MEKNDVESEVWAYWAELCAGRPMPLRSEVDPRGLENALDHAFVAERTQTGLVRLRVVGAALNRLMNMDTRGMPISSFFDPLSRHRIKSEMNKVFMTPSILRVAVTSLGHEGPLVRGRWLILPLKGQDGQIDRAMGTYVTQGETRAPFRPLIDTVELTKIKVPEGYMKKPAEAKSREMAEAAAPFQGRQEQAQQTIDLARQGQGAQKPFLRIVRSND